jgi:nucleoside 2-deoxyribosyltransferase
MLVYLAGHYNADIYRARASTALLRCGHAPLDPMRRDYRGIEDDSVQELVQGDLRDIVDCTHVLANFSTDDTGTSMECWFAHSIGRPVHAFVDREDQRIGPWVRYIATTVSIGFDNALVRMRA